MAKSKWRAWLQLLRAPNLFTVPGDPLAGYLLAAPAPPGLAVLAPIVASLGFYIYGLLCNDLFDLAEDRAERPERPLPQRAANVRSVGIVATVCAASALAICIYAGQVAWIVGVALASAILLYDGWSKKIAVLGALNMGACRGLSVLLGAVCGGSITPVALAAAMNIALYVAAVTNLARHETKSAPPIFVKCLPLFVLSISPCVFASGHMQIDVPVFIVFFSLAFFQAAFATFRALRGAPLPPVIGSMIRTLIPLQAAFCGGSHTGWYGGGAALLLLALWPLSRLVGRRFYAS